jgi:hypothetical protein
MSHVIQFLAAMGSSPGKLSAVEYAATVSSLGFDLPCERALIDRDPATLNELLGGRESMRCIVWPTEGFT